MFPSLLRDRAFFPTALNWGKRWRGCWGGATSEAPSCACPPFPPRGPAAAAWPYYPSAPAACGHQGASGIRGDSTRVPAALSQDLGGCFPTSPSPCCWGRGQPSPLFSSGWWLEVPRARRCPLGLGLLSRARPSPSLHGDSLLPSLTHPF